MKTDRRLWLLGLGVLAAACGSAANPSAERTLAGVPKQQAMVNAQHVLALEGINVTAFDPATGEIQSDWAKSGGQSQIRYAVSVSEGASSAEGSDAGPAEGLPMLVISVRAEKREKIVGGWREAPDATSSRARHLLDDIVDMSVSRASEQAPAPPPPVQELEARRAADTSAACDATPQCPIGTHCGSGRCVFECSAALGCDAGFLCDERGRCVAPPPPAPAPEVASSGEDASDRDRARKERRAKREKGKEGETDAE